MGNDMDIENRGRERNAKPKGLIAAGHQYPSTGPASVSDGRGEGLGGQIGRPLTWHRIHLRRR